VKKLVNSFKRRKGLVFITASLSILVLLLIFPAAASVSDWESSPQKLVSGDTLHIKGSASPGEKIDVFVNFEKTVPVSGGKFEYVLEDVKIPEGSNNFFTVEASGVKNLNVRVKMLIWITKSSQASGNTAIVSQSGVPAGTYKIKIDGDAGDGVSEVNLKIKAFQGIEADSKGDFSYSYNTKSIPPGGFEVNVGGITKEINVQPKEISGPSSTGSFSGSSSTGSSSGSSSTDSSSTGSSSTESSPVETEKTSIQPKDTSSSTSVSSLVGSSSVKTGSSIEPTTSKTLGEKGVSEASTLDKTLEEKDAQKQLSGEGVQVSKSSKPLVDKFYLLAGIVAGILILIVYSRRK